MILVYTYHMTCILAIWISATFLDNSNSQWSAVIQSSILQCQLINLLVLAGLGGRSMLAGIGSAALVAAVAYLTWMSVHLRLQVDMWKFAMAFPLMVTVWSFPLLVARRNWGWQLVHHSAPSIPFRRLRVEDYFLITTSAATLWVMFLRSSNPIGSGWFSSSVAILLISGFLLQAYSIALMAIVYNYFRRGIDDTYLMLMLSLVMVPHHLLPILFGGWDQLLVTIVGTGLCGVGSAFGFMLYRLAGMQLTYYESLQERDDAELTEEDRHFVHSSQRSARVATALFVVVAVMAISITTLLDSGAQL